VFLSIINLNTISTYHVIRCVSSVGAVPNSGTAAVLCTNASPTVLVISLGLATFSSSFPGVSSSVLVTFVNGGISVVASHISIVDSIQVVSTFPTEAYVSSTITLLGSNFIASQSCIAKIGASPCSGISLSYCNIISDSQVVITIDNTNVAVGAAGICISLSNPLTIWASSIGNVLSIVASPSIISAKPVQGYISSSITVSGYNFIVNNYTCIMTVGTVQASFCKIVSTQSVIFIVPAKIAVGSKILYLNFNNGGSGATAVAPGAIFNVVSSPTLNAFSPNPSYSTSRVTVTVSVS
jgi:hypothetical protein